MNIHSCHTRFIIPLNHTQKFPAISFIETCVVCNQVDGGYPFGFHILYNDIKQLSCNPLTTIFLFGIHCTYIGRKVFSVMKIIFNYAKTAYNTLSI